MFQALAYPLALGLGLAFGLYLPLNSLTARTLGSPFLANVAFFAFGLATAIAISVLAGTRAGEMARFREVPWWMFGSGIMSGLMILGSAYLIPLIGPGVFFVLFVSGQVLMGTAISHFGWLGVPPDAATIRTAAGIGCVIIGVWLVTGR